MATQISRQEYAGLFGPTTGDKIRLGDTDLYIESRARLAGPSATRPCTAAARPSATAWAWTTS